MSSSFRAVRRIQFCAGHRVHLHESKCRNPHGHNYVALLHAEAVPDRAQLDSLGRVIDFGILKEKLGGWIDEFWDHGFIYMEGDTAMQAALSGVTLAEDPGFACKSFMLPVNPTAENMAAYLLHRVGPAVLADTGVRLVRVVLWETENCYADVSLGDRPSSSAKHERKRAVLETQHRLAEEYVREGEHQDGDGFWDHFPTDVDVLEDFERYCKGASEDADADEHTDT